MHFICTSKQVHTFHYKQNPKCLSNLGFYHAILWKRSWLSQLLQLAQLFWNHLSIPCKQTLVDEVTSITGRWSDQLFPISKLNRVHSQCQYGCGLLLECSLHHSNIFSILDIRCLLRQSIVSNEQTQLDSHLRHLCELSGEKTTSSKMNAHYFNLLVWLYYRSHTSKLSRIFQPY